MEGGITNNVIDHNIDPRGWFRVILHTSNLRIHKVNHKEEDNLPTLNMEKGWIGDISLLTESHFYEDI